MLELYDLTTEHLSNPIGIDADNPRFSWKIRSSRKNVRQYSWRIKVSDGHKLMWDSGEHIGDQSQNIIYAGKKLHSRQRLVWSVHISDGTEAAENTARFEMGIMSPDEWKCTWIEPEDKIDSNSFSPAPYLRKTFMVKDGLISARAYQTAHGIYRYWVNGRSCTERRFAPGNTSYYGRLQYQSDDITQYLAKGENVWSVCLGDGWWRGACGAFDVRNNYGKKVQFFGQLVLEYEDGTVEYVISDERFRTSTGGYLQTDMKIGTVFDAEKEPKGWKIPGFDDSEWKYVQRASNDVPDNKILVAEQSPYCREKEQYAGHAFVDAAGDTVIDFGKNIAGYVRMKLHHLKPGQIITLEHGEILVDGKFDTCNIVQGTSIYKDFQKVTYHAQGKEEEEFVPEYSIFGFRYVRVRGYGGKIEPGDFTAIAVYSDLRVTGKFSCSEPLLNRLYENALNSQKSNFLDVPTDCPTRERSPYTGDAQVYCRTASEMMDVYSFFEKWMKELEYEKADNGQVPSIMPCISFHSKQNKEEFLDKIRSEKGLEFLIAALEEGELGKSKTLDGSAGWGDAAVIIPWTMYLCYGDRKIVENQYATAKAWVGYMIRHASRPNELYASESQYHTKTYEDHLDAEYIWDTDFHWGEWSEPEFVEKTLPVNFVEEKVKYGEPAVATAYLKYSAELLSKMADILGKTKDAAYYKEYSRRTAEIYERHLIREDGSIKYTEQGKQAPYVRALKFGLCKKKKESVKKQLLKNIRRTDYHLNTGFLSTGFLLNVLADEGESEAAYRILEQTSAPSWLYPIINGATAMLESWDGVQKNFGSFNHYAFGAVCDFLFQYIAGIRPCDEVPGYKKIRLEPVPGGTLTEAAAEYESIYGTIYSSWKIEGEKIKFQFEIPANIEAEIVLPNGETYQRGSGKYIFEQRRN